MELRASLLSITYANRLQTCFLAPENKVKLQEYVTLKISVILVDCHVIYFVSPLLPYQCLTMLLETTWLTAVKVEVIRIYLHWLSEFKYTNTIKIIMENMKKNNTHTNISWQQPDSNFRKPSDKEPWECHHNIISLENWLICLYCHSYMDRLRWPRGPLSC